MATDDTKPTEPVVSDYDAMSSVFDELTVPEPDPKSTEGEPTSEVEKPEGDAAPAADAKPPVETPPVETPPVETAPAAETPAAPTPTEGEDWEARFKELEAKVERPPTAEKPPVEAPPPDMYAPDEKDFLATYEKDWPDIVKGEALRRRAEYAQIVNHVFSEIARAYGPLIERGAMAADTVAETNTMNTIMAAHADYDDAMYNDVMKWAEGLTGTRKRIVEAVIAEGEPQELVELITDFKSATGRKPRVVAGTANAAPAAGVTELSAKAKQAAKALGVVDSKRTAPVTTAADPDDFEAAWDEALGSK
jgi:hypothetical protein